nr:PREDICTED: flocculation protein FLO11-like [Bemisia tabaci]
MAQMNELFLLKKYFGHVETQQDEHITEYKAFLQNLVESADPTDELPVRVPPFRFSSLEIPGAVINWAKQYLEARNCPAAILTPLIRKVFKSVFESSEDVVDASQPLNSIKFSQSVIKQLVKVCEEYSLNDDLLRELPPPAELSFPVSKHAFKNSRRTMEDRFCVVEDLNGLFGLKDPGSISFYAVYDGHAGIDAAEYSAAYLHQYLTESPNYPHDLKAALRDAFLKTDECVLQIPRSSGTTAVCAVVDHQDSMLHVAWAGDSEAVISMNGKAMQLVNPHRASRPDEVERVTKAGGEVLYYDMCWRIKGRLAVSRAIGDKSCKPHVCADPDFNSVALDGTEEFLILGSDGLWDALSPDVAVKNILIDLLNGKDPERAAEALVHLAKKDSKDNITAVVVFLRPPEVIAQSHSLKSLAQRSGAPAASAHAQAPATATMDQEALFGNSNGNGPNGNMFASNGCAFRSPCEFDSDFGPETNVDFGEAVNGTNAHHPMIIPDIKSLKEEKKLKLERDSEEDDDDDDEDERWDYTKGDVKIEDASSHNDLNNHFDNLDHALNPNAAEFVPTSPVEKSSSVSETNPGLTNNVPFSPDACKSAFFENSVCDLKNTNYEPTNGFGNDTTHTNNFEGTKEVDCLAEGDKNLLLQNHIDELSTGISSEAPLSNSLSSTIANANETRNSAFTSALEDFSTDGLCNISGLSNISAEKSDDFLDPDDNSKFNNLEYSAISPEKPHEFSLLESASNQTNELKDHEQTVDADPFNLEIQPNSESFNSSETPKNAGEAQNPFATEGGFECRKDNFSHLKGTLEFSPDTVPLECKEESKAELAFSPDVVVESKEEELEAVKKSDSVFSSSTDIPTEQHAGPTEESGPHDFVESFGNTEEPEKKQPSFDFEMKSEPVVVESKTELTEPRFDFEMKSEPVVVESRTELTDPFDIPVKTEEISPAPPGYSNEISSAQDFFSSNTEQNSAQDFTETNNISDNLQKPEEDVTKDACVNPFIDSITPKQESEIVSNLTPIPPETLDQLDRVIEVSDNFAFEDSAPKTEEVKPTEDLVTYEGKPEPAEPEKIVENPFSDQISGISESIENLHLTESSFAAPPSPPASEVSKAEAENVGIQDDQALIADLTVNEEFSNAEDVVNKLTEEFEKSFEQSEPVTSTPFPSSAKVAAVGAAAVAAVAAAGVAAGASDTKKSSAPKPATSKPSVAKSKPTTKPTTSTQPTPKSPAPKKPVPSKASPAKTSVAAKAAPSTLLKSKVSTTTTAAPAAAAKKPAATSTLKPRVPLSSRPASSTSTTKPPTTRPTTATKPAPKPLTNGVASRTTTSTLPKRPATAPAATRASTATATTKAAPRPTPRTVAAPRTTAARPAPSTAKSTVPARPAAPVAQRRPISIPSKTLDKKEPAKPSTLTARTTLATRKVDPKKAAPATTATSPQKPLPIRRPQPKTNQTEVKKETVVENGMDTKENSTS